jgi:signal transduction histidine kinase
VSEEISAGELRADLEAVRSVLSHDLRAPARQLRALIDALLEDCATTLDDAARQYVQRIGSVAQRLDDHLLAVLDYSKLALRDLCSVSLDLSAVVDEVLTRLAKTMEGARLDRQDLEQRVTADPHTLAQVLTHLLANAVKFVHLGETPNITITATRNGSRVRLTVLDRGIGVPVEHRGRIFAMGERLHGEDHYPGHGIGLAFVRRAMERMHGAVGVESGLGEGSAFWIELPAESAP